MPELPEVEVIKIFLEDKLLGLTITDLEVLTPKSFIGDPELVEGQKITKFTRIGKQLSIYLGNGKILLVHLKMTGQLILGDTMLGHPTKFDKYPNKSTRLIFRFTPSFSKRGQGEILYFNDQRKFGWVKLYNSQSELAEDQQHLGRDIFDPQFTSEYIYSQLQRSSRAVKLVLLDQNFFAGIGNIYANDALFLSQIYPGKAANKITRLQSKKIHQHLLDIMQQSVAAGGSTMKDNQYVRPDDSYGNNQFFFRVYQRAGKPCLVCATLIKRMVIGGRGTFFCPKCQKLSL